MAHQLSGHLWNAAILVASASVALAAERLTAPSKRPASSGALDAAAGDIASFVAPLRADSVLPRFHMSVWSDPFGRRLDAGAQSGVASATSRPTVPPASATGRALTAILISDKRRVAVIDDAAVGVGDVLRDGARVSAIQPDRVWVVEKNGRWRMLTLSNQGTK
jgi:hypothetical protein